ncbi:MAG: hypothetical protein IKB01_02355 [Lachnospiraceae bacterium]|nr:hypothetical protein [Lachnospiraceae bacterium]MBR2401597.1 hypothetical protein [Lachnospiraceae bacterium]
MLSFFRKNNVDVQPEKDLVYSMVRLLSQNQGDVLYELLISLEPFYGEGCVLSVVERDTRDLLATTKEEQKEAIRRTAMGVRELEKPQRYIREEKNAMYFRSPFTSIQVFPFRCCGKSRAFLMVEQKFVLEPSLGRAFEVLEIAVRMRMYEYLAERNISFDRKTLLRTRDKLVERMKGSVDTDEYLGVFSLINKEELGLREGIVGIDRAMLDMADVIRNAFGENGYVLADTKVGVVLKGPVFEAAGSLQSCLDTFVEYFPRLKIGVVLSPRTDEVFRILYLCEKACESCQQDMVLVIRNPEEYLNTGGEIVEMIYNSRPGEEEKEGNTANPGKSKSEACEPEDGLEGDGEYVEYVFEAG